MIENSIWNKLYINLRVIFLYLSKHILLNPFNFCFWVTIYLLFMYVLDITVNKSIILYLIIKWNVDVTASCGTSVPQV